MFEALERLPAAEAKSRHERLKKHLTAHAPGAAGMLCFSRVALYYFTGSAVAGVAWLPVEGEPLLLVRKGLERARLESPVTVAGFKSFGELSGLAAEHGAPLGSVVAVEGQGLTWSLGQLLAAKLPDVRLAAGDGALARTMAVKSSWELDKLTRCGALHHRALREELPKHIRPGMSERDIALKVWEVFFALGHGGLMRMSPGGDEVFLGHVAAGDSGNYPSGFNGPLGLRGEHPATPVMGSAAKVWEAGEPLAVDCAFAVDGYTTDLTQMYVAQEMPPEAAQAQTFCEDLQAWLAAELKPGAIPSGLYAECLERAAAAGLSESFMGLGDNQVRFVGHGIGLVVDGFPVIAKGFDEPLEENMVLALEPKVGLAGYGMVGVENTFVVTASGGRCLTADGDTEFGPILI